MSMTSRIQIIDRAPCQGCGVFVCQPGTYLCARCEREFVDAVDAEAALRDLDVEVEAMWIEEQLRKSGSL